MTDLSHPEMTTFVNQLIAEILETREAGQAEYAQDAQNVFANFDRIADRLDISREVVIMTFLAKHVDGIFAHVAGLDSQREGVRGRIVDAIVYLMLLGAALEGEAFKINTQIAAGYGCGPSDSVSFTS